MNEEMQGRILAYLDGELAAGERRELESGAERSAELRSLLEEVRARSGVVRRSLRDERVPVPDPALALRQIRLRLEEDGHERGGRLRRDLARAAGIALLVGAAGLSATLSGSPVRAWLQSLWHEPVPGATTRSIEAASPPAAADAAETAIHLAAPAPGLRIVVQSLPVGAELSVRSVPGSTLSLYAPEGSRFLSGSDRVVVSAAAGPVRIELPHALERATVQLGDEVILEMTDSRVSAPDFEPAGGPGHLIYRSRGG